MKHVLAAFILCSLLAVAQAPDVLTTDAVIKMVQSGVPNQTIIRTIQSAAQVNFTFLPDDLELMIRAKVPEDVFKAMAAKTSARSSESC
jgi:parvulin-like peptidyl-prolyl isomerase